MLKNKFFYIILFTILVIYAYKFFVFNHYIIREIVIENQSNRSNTETIKNKLKFTLEKPLHLLNLRDIKESIESIDWIKKWDSISDVDYSKAKINWFEGARLNVSYNCIDRHVESGYGDSTAIIWEGNESSDSKIITYQELLNQSCKD